MADAYRKLNRSEERLKAIAEGLTLVEKIGKARLWQFCRRRRRCLRNSAEAILIHQYMESHPAFC